MTDPSHRLRGQPHTSLATKIIFFVFAALFVTAAAISWASIHATYAQTHLLVERHYPASLARAAEHVELWLEAGRLDLAALPRDGAPTGLPVALASVLTEDLPHPDASLLFVDTGGRVRARVPAVSHAPQRIPLEPAVAGGTHRYTNDAGRVVVGAAHRLGGGEWQLAVEVPFTGVYAPVLAVAARIFVIDLAIVLLFSLLAYQVTTAMVKPIEALSESARRIAQGDLDLEIPDAQSRDEIGLLTRSFADMMRRLRRSQAELESTNRALVSRNEFLSQLSITDGLTHLHNHRFFQDHLTREIKRVLRADEPLSMLVIDIDDFKRLNDRLGHAAGDELLAGMARIMSQCVRDSDLLARYGGEEFVVLASNTGRKGAYQLAEKIRMSIEEASFILDDSLRPTRITVSVGVARFEGDRKRFFDAADQALYRAKAAGKNCVVTDRPIEGEEEEEADKPD